MELCSGKELFDKVKETKSFDEARTNSVVFKIVKAIYYSHLEGVTHRDLKLENIMFENDTDDAEIKIIDWGLSAKYIKDKTRLSTITGTPQFIAPEVFKGCYDDQCDIWSIGVITYVILAWKYPYKGNNVKDYLQSLKNDEVKYDYPALLNVSQNCLNFIKACMNQDPKQRLKIQQCYEHEWFNDIKFKLQSVELDSNVLINLRKYNAPKKKLQLFIEKHFINLLYSLEDIKELRNQFQYMDLNGQGFITMDELKEAYKRANIILEDDEVKAIMSRVDKRKNGMLDYSEFLIAAIDYSTVVEKNNLIKMFKFFDEDNSGYIDISNLKSLLLRTMHKEKMPSDVEFSEIIAEVGSKSVSNAITQEEFLACFGYKS